MCLQGKKKEGKITSSSISYWLPIWALYLGSFLTTSISPDLHPPRYLSQYIPTRTEPVYAYVIFQESHLSRRGSESCGVGACLVGGDILQKSNPPTLNKAGLCKSDCKKLSRMCQETEKQETRASLALELAKQTVSFGVVLNLQATWAASLALPWGLGAAGASATRTFVDAGDVQGDCLVHYAKIMSILTVYCCSAGRQTILLVGYHLCPI